MHTLPHPIPIIAPTEIIAQGNLPKFATPFQTGKDTNPDLHSLIENIQ
jgi:hypothetical protein